MPAPLLCEQGRLSLPQRLVWLAYDTRQRYNALGDGNRSGGPEHSWPVQTAINVVLCQTEQNTYIHYIVENNECSTTCLLFISDADLTNATIPSKEVVQVLTSDLVVEVLHEKDSVRTGGQFGLCGYR